MTHEDLPSFSFQYNQQSPFPAILQMATLKTKKRTRILNVFHLHPKTCASLNHPHVLPSFQSRNLQENWDKLHKDPTTKIAKNDTLQGSNISPKNWHFEDDFPFPKVGYVNSLEGISSSHPFNFPTFSTTNSFLPLQGHAAGTCP